MDSGIFRVGQFETNRLPSPGGSRCRFVYSSNYADHKLLRSHTIEPLESRQYLTTGIAVVDDPGINNYYIRVASGQVQVFQNQPLAATPTYQVPVADIGSISITNSSSNDSITVDYSGGNPIPGGLGYGAEATSPAIMPSLHIVGLANATYSLQTQFLNVVASGISDSVYMVNGTANTAFDLFSGGGTDLFKATSGSSVTFGTDLGASGTTVNLNVSSGATVKFSSTEHLNTVNVLSGGSLQMVPWGGNVLDVNTLTVGGVLDMTNNDLIVNTPTSSAMTTLLEQAGTGITDAASTSGVGSTQGIIYSSTAGVDGMVLGVAPVADLYDGPAELDGQTLASTALVGRYTLPGDDNLDGLVNGADVSILAANYGLTTGTTPPEWYAGDVNYDGIVNSGDLDIISASSATKSPSRPTSPSGRPISSHCRPPRRTVRRRSAGMSAGAMGPARTTPSRAEPRQM